MHEFRWDALTDSDWAIILIILVTVAGSLCLYLSKRKDDGSRSDDK